MRWAGHVAHMGEKYNAYRGSVRNLNERDHLKDTRTDGSKLLKWILKKYKGHALDSSGSG
jgi:hypothetical protein